MNKEVLLVKLCQNKIMLFHSFLNFENILVFSLALPYKVFVWDSLFCDDIFMVEENF